MTCIVVSAALAQDGGPPEHGWTDEVQPGVRLYADPPRIGGRPTAWPAVQARLEQDPDAADVLVGGYHRTIIGAVIASAGVTALGLATEAWIFRGPGTTMPVPTATGLVVGLPTVSVGAVFLLTAGQRATRQRAVNVYNEDQSR